MQKTNKAIKKWCGYTLFIVSASMVSFFIAEAVFSEATGKSNPSHLPDQRGGKTLKCPKHPHYVDRDYPGCKEGYVMDATIYYAKVNALQGEIDRIAKALREYGNHKDYRKLQEAHNTAREALSDYLSYKNEPLASEKITIRNEVSDWDKTKADQLSASEKQRLTRLFFNVLSGGGGRYIFPKTNFFARYFRFNELSEAGLELAHLHTHIRRYAYKSSLPAYLRLKEMAQAGDQDAACLLALRLPADHPKYKANQREGYIDFAEVFKLAKQGHPYCKAFAGNVMTADSGYKWYRPYANRALGIQYLNETASLGYETAADRITDILMEAEDLKIIEQELRSCWFNLYESLNIEAGYPLDVSFWEERGLTLYRVKRFLNNPYYQSKYHCNVNLIEVENELQ